MGRDATGQNVMGRFANGHCPENKIFKVFLYLVAELQEQYGDVIGVYLGNKPTIWLHDPLKGKIHLLTKPHNNLAQSYIFL
jgi:hypothetical protein